MVQDAWDAAFGPELGAHLSKDLLSEALRLSYLDGLWPLRSEQICLDIGYTDVC